MCNTSRSPCPGPEVVAVEAGETYLIRFINGGSLSHLSAAIEGHSMTIVEVDGMPTSPTPANVIDFNSGQRYGVLVTANQPAGVYTIRFKFRNDMWSDTTGHAFLRYSGATQDVDAVDPTQVQLEHPNWDNNTFTFNFQNSMRGLYGAGGLPPVPGNDKVERRFQFLVTNENFQDDAPSHLPAGASTSADDIAAQIGQGAQKPENFCEHNSTSYDRWAMGRRTFHKPRTPILSKLFFGIGADDFKEEASAFRVEMGKVYDIVVQSYPACYKVCETHAWHLHGMHFWVLGTFRGQWVNSAEQIAAFNLADPVYRDTVMTVGEGEGNVPSDNAGCGYVVVRFVVDTPGTWLFHCHHMPDVLTGASVLFYTPADTLPSPPSNLLLCGDMTVGAAAEKMHAGDGMTCADLKRAFRQGECCGAPGRRLDSSRPRPGP